MTIAGGEGTLKKPGASKVTNNLMSLAERLQASAKK